MRIQAGAGQSGPIQACSLAVAAWMRYVMGVDEVGHKIVVQDPMAGRFEAIYNSAGPRADLLVDAFLGVDEVFGKDLKGASRFRKELVYRLESLLNVGALNTVEEFVAAIESGNDHEYRYH